VRVGIIGLGIGTRHITLFRPLDGVEVAAVADTNRKVAEKVAGEYGITPYGDALAMMDREKLDAVSICTPPRFHASLNLAAAQRGLHILCEKPMATTPAECDTMIEAVQKSRVTLMLGFKKRYAPAYAFLKEREAEWGAPRIASVRYQLGAVSKEWFWDESDGGGPLVENTAHMFDLLRYLFGDAEKVYAETSNFFSKRWPAAIAEAVFTIRFRSGATAGVAAGAAGVWAYDASERVGLSYDEQIAEVWGPFDRPEHLRLLARTATEVVEKEWPDEDPSGFAQEIAAFVRCVQGKATPRATGIDGKRALQLSLAVKQSGRPVILES
jgi:predicted dehydrogenase